MDFLILLSNLKVTFTLQEKKASRSDCPGLLRASVFKTNLFFDCDFFPLFLALHAFFFSYGKHFVFRGEKVFSHWGGTGALQLLFWEKGWFISTGSVDGTVFGMGSNGTITKIKKI